MVEEDSQKKIAADFQCFVCGAIFTSENDRRQHLEKEMHNATEKKDVNTVKRQTEMSEMHKQAYESV
jgi:peptidyl-tRNA hydrolase